MNTEEKTGDELESPSDCKISSLNSEGLTTIVSETPTIQEATVNEVAPESLIISAAMESATNTPTSRASWTSEASQDSQELLIKNQPQFTPPIPHSTAPGSYDRQSSTSTDSVASHDMLLPNPGKPLAKPVEVIVTSSHVDETYC